MNQQTSTTADAHQEIQLLLPWYLNQSLEQDEQRQVETHVAHCLLCRHELVSLGKLAKAVTFASDLDLASEASLAGLHAKLQARTAGRFPAAPPIKPSLIGRFGNYASQRSRLTRLSSHPGTRFAVAASLFLTVITLTVGFVQSPAPADYYTLSAEKPELPAGANLRVVFSKTLPDSDIDTMLAPIHGQRIDGPNNVGAFTVRIKPYSDNQDLQNALTYLRSRQDVVLAEPVVQP